jgi:sodium-dependent dicarboxylate transporter 2/3/5
MMPGRNSRQKWGLFSGAALFVLLLVMPRPGSMTPEALRVAAVAALMAVWWITEAVPLAVTALLPAALFPILGVMSAQQSTAPYANHLIFLFLGGFLIAVAIERWDLHRRIALQTIRLVGVSPPRIILGFMVASAVLSMWISNTATAMMMVPIGLAVIKQSEQSSAGSGREIMKDGSNFGTALMLGIAYSASIGGVATIIGTPPNVIMAGFIENTFGREISFAAWMAFALPLSAVMLMLTWLYITKLAFPIRMKEIPGGREFVGSEIARLGPMTSQEKKVLGVFILVASCWIARGFIRIPSLSMVSDSTIAIMGAVLLFLIPSDFSRGEFLLDWKTAEKIPWGVIILFGGGLSLAHGFNQSGLDNWVGSRITCLQDLGYVALISGSVIITIFLTEITSNTATSAMLIPMMSSISISMAIHPYGPIIAACIAASYAFMLPVATPPNAVIFASRQVTIRQMARTGLMLNILGWLMITAAVVLLLPHIFGIDLSALPVWASGG